MTSSRIFARCLLVPTHFPTTKNSIGVLFVLIMKHFDEWHGGVNTLLVRDEWLMAVDGWLNDIRKPLIHVR